MHKLLALSAFAALVSLSQVTLAGESQNPHDAVNQPTEESQNPHDAANQPGGADIGLQTGGSTGTVNPNSLGRTGRLNRLDGTQNDPRNTGVQAPATNDTIDNRIEDINNDDRALRDRLDGSPVPTPDPGLNSDLPGQPIPPGQGPAVNTDGSTSTGTDGSSDTGNTGNSGTPATGTGGTSSSSTVSGPSSGGTPGSATSSGGAAQ